MRAKQYLKLFSRFFCSIGEKLSQSVTTQEKHKFKENLSHRIFLNIYLEAPNLSEIANSIQSLNVNKALRHDNIPPYFLIIASHVKAPYLQVFMDFSFNNGISPNNCEIAKIYPLH